MDVQTNKIVEFGTILKFMKSNIPNTSLFDVIFLLTVLDHMNWMVGELTAWDLSFGRVDHSVLIKYIKDKTTLPNETKRCLGNNQSGRKAYIEYYIPYKVSTWYH